MSNLIIPSAFICLGKYFNNFWLKEYWVSVKLQGFLSPLYLVMGNLNVPFISLEVLDQTNLNRFRKYFLEKIMYQKDCNFKPFCFLIKSVLALPLWCNWEERLTIQSAAVCLVVGSIPGPTHVKKNTFVESKTHRYRIFGYRVCQLILPITTY